MTFFSGTDTSTLLEEGKDRNHFVSLIVNNAGTYTAAITRKAVKDLTISGTLKYKSFDDTEIELGELEPVKTQSTVVEYFMLDVEKHEAQTSLKKELEDAFSSLPAISKTLLLKSVSAEHAAGAFPGKKPPAGCSAPVSAVYRLCAVHSAPL